MTAGAAIGGGSACGLFESESEQDNDTWTYVGSRTESLSYHRSLSDGVGFYNGYTIIGCNEIGYGQWSGIYFTQGWGTEGHDAHRVVGSRAMSMLKI